jgi:hypothetical protein
MTRMERMVVDDVEDAAAVELILELNDEGLQRMS